MCTNCEGTVITVPIGEPGNPGVDGVGINGNNGTEEKVVFDTSLSIVYNSTTFLSTIPLDNNGVPETTAFRTIGYFIFPGTDNLNNISPNKLYILASIVNGNLLSGLSANWIVRVRNSNNVVIAESTDIINSLNVLVDLGAVTNLPEQLDIFTIEVYLVSQDNNNTTIYLNSLLLIQE